jgi:acetyltransferase-like isoleucine patch superfamily enzyme/2-polyprenyl-3-methyl-5-hydroxy-6-metoxy-1,4-benzoquinol methylase
MTGIADLEKIKHRGWDISASTGFRVHHGYDHIHLGNHIRLANTLINAGDNEGEVIIEDYVFCGHNVMILARDHDYKTFGVNRQLSIREKKIHIKTGAWLASGAIILGGVTIGEHAVVGAGSVVTKDVPAYTLVAGNPAAVVKEISHHNDNDGEKRVIVQGRSSPSQPILKAIVSPSRGKTVQAERFASVLKHVSGDEKVLDIGSARGAYTYELRKRGNFVIGMDIIQYDDWSLKTPKYFVNASGEYLPFQNKSFDVSLAFEVLEHIPQIECMLQEVHRCTTNKFILSVPNCDLDNKLHQHNLSLAHWTDTTHRNFFTKATIVNLLTDNGFEILEISDCYKIVPSHYFWDSVKLPNRVGSFFKRLFDWFNLVETYWSSILVVAAVKQ